MRQRCATRWDDQEHSEDAQVALNAHNSVCKTWRGPIRPKAAVGDGHRIQISSLIPKPIGAKRGS